MKKFIAAALQPEFTSCWRSWTYINEEFADDFQALQAAGSLKMNGQFPMIWRTKQKFVLKGTAPSGKTFAYKSYCKLKGTIKYLFRLSPCGMEAENFQLISDCGIALPRLLAVGDTRQGGLLKTAFLITEFAEGYSDGRDFTNLKGVVKDPALRDEFILRNLELLAKLHDNNILHRGFTPANLLYKVRQTPDEQGNQLDLMWIDIASCRKLSKERLKNSMKVDFEQLFRFFEFSNEELLKYIKHYCQSTQEPLKEPEEILSELKKQLQKRSGKA